MAKNVLALIDFSEVTEDVLKYAGEIAGLYGAKCWLVHVAAPDPDFVGYDVGPKYIRDSRADVLKEEHKTLGDFAHRLKEREIDCEALLVQGPLYKTIMDEINKLNIDLIVAGSHGRSLVRDLIVGSVSEHLLRHATVPLLIVPSKKG